MATSRQFSVCVAMVAVVLFSAGQAQAQDRNEPGAAIASAVEQPAPERPVTVDFREALRTFDYSTMVVAPQTVTAASQTTAEPRKRSHGRQTLGVVLGAVGGFFAGAFIGGAIDGQRRSSDGMAGVLFGAPIGAVTLAILGAKYF